MPLSSMVGITNTGDAFPLAYCYITSESGKSFEFVAEQLTKYIFFDCSQPAVIVADFAKGLGKAIAMKAHANADLETPGDEADGFPSVEEVIVDGVKEQERIRLQCCEWYAVEAIKKRLVHTGNYSNKRREELVDLVNAWINCPLDEVEKARASLISQLDPDEREYLTSIYQPKETSFLRAYTTRYRNLGVHSTQCNESLHPITKRRLRRSLVVSQAIECILEDLEAFVEEHNKRVDRDRRHIPALLDPAGFKDVGEKLTNHCLEKAMTEWAKAQKIVAEEETGVVAEFDLESGCRACELPLRYGIPCSHWMAVAIRDDMPLPASLFHPRWFLDEPHVDVVKNWRMCLSFSSPNSPILSGNGDAGKEVLGPSNWPDLEPMRLDGSIQPEENKIKDTALPSIQFLKSLPAGDAENYALAALDCIAKLAAKKQLESSGRKAPHQLSRPLLTPNTHSLFNGRKRAIAGHEAAEGEGVRVARARRQAETEAQATYDEQPSVGKHYSC